MKRSRVFASLVFVIFATAAGAASAQTYPCGVAMLVPLSACSPPPALADRTPTPGRAHLREGIGEVGDARARRPRPERPDRDDPLGRGRDRDRDLVVRVDVALALVAGRGHQHGALPERGARLDHLHQRSNMRRLPR